jgi:hypothetical protein
VKIEYKPEDTERGEAQTWTFDPRRIRATEAVIIQKRFGKTWDEFLVAVQAGDVEARRVLLWHLIRRTHPILRFEDTPDFLLGELEVSHELSELIQLRARVEKASLPAEQKEPVLAALDVEISDAMAALDVDTDDPEAVAETAALAEGKAPSSDAGGATG